jgi:glyoxylase-like metal-dependent hydrolase (beta-lactamase superfamily II)
LWSIPVPIPDSPLRYTLAYAFGLDDGVLLVDPGWDTLLGREALSKGLAQMGAALSDVSGVVVTHVHADHHGLSAHVREASGAWIAMHPLERDSLPGRAAALDPERVADGHWLHRCGVPEYAYDDLVIAPEAMIPLLRLPEPDVLVQDGDPIPLTVGRLRAVWTPGHTPGHLCFYDAAEDVFLTGDHVLPRISPHVGLQPHDAEPPLAAYLASLARVAVYDSAEVLPAHEYRFRGLDDRVRALQRHHAHRCEEIVETLTVHGESTVWGVAQQLTWSRGWTAVHGLMRRAALAETLAHLNHLRDQGLVVEIRHPRQEPVLFSAASAS